MNYALRRILIGASATALILLATPAHAHVDVSSPDAEPGGYGKLVFRVPNESDTADTTMLRVTLPADLPFATASTLDVPGWTAEVQVEKLDEPVAVGDLMLTEAPRTVTWTAEPGEGIEPDEFAEFSLSAGPFVDDPAATYEFAAVQTYSDGEVVAWDQSAEGDAEPELPAPVLELEEAAASADAPAAESGADDLLARILGGAALLVGLAVLALVVAGRRARPEAS